MFIEIEEDCVSPEEIINNFLSNKLKTIEEVKKEKKLLGLLIIELKEKMQLSKETFQL